MCIVMYIIIFLAPRMVDIYVRQNFVLLL